MGLMSNQGNQNPLYQAKVDALDRARRWFKEGKLHEEHFRAILIHTGFNSAGISVEMHEHAPGASLWAR